MPIEGKELIIKANVQQGQSNEGAPNDKMKEEWKAEIIAACIEQMMKILKSKKERS